MIVPIAFIFLIRRQISTVICSLRQELQSYMTIILWNKLGSISKPHVLVKLVKNMLT